MLKHYTTSKDMDVTKVVNPEGQHRIVLICEHASNFVPEKFENLGLTQEELTSHIAWDPGALETAKQLSKLLDAPLVQSTISRLVYDCNRPPEAASAMPETSENFAIPGNHNLTDTERLERVNAYYRPFERLVSDVLDRRGEQAIVVTIHSFTRFYLGAERAVEIGILHDDDSRMADVMLHNASGYRVERNQPYGPDDGVTHTLRRHAMPRGLLNVMIEVRNDLIETQQQCADMANTLAGWISQGIEQLATSNAKEVAR